VSGTGRFQQGILKNESSDFIIIFFLSYILPHF
jgi:hypothetical protein